LAPSCRNRSSDACFVSAAVTPPQKHPARHWHLTHHSEASSSGSSSSC
jgi:hypothetical protein